MHPRKMIILDGVFGEEFPVGVDFVFFLRDANPLVEAVSGEARRQIAHAFGERRRVVGGVGENEAAPFANGDRQQSEVGAIERRASGGRRIPCAIWRCRAE